VTLPRLLDGSIRVAGYPLAMVHAEKLVTAVQRGAANTRWRDFVDIYALTRRHDIDGDELTSATRQVAEHRGTRLTSLGEALGDHATRSQRRWATWLRKQRLEDRFPREFDELIAAIREFADPVLLGAATSRTWNAAHLGWVPAPQLIE
jgi:hypothetical protein